MAATDDEARSFAASFRAFLEWVHADVGQADRGNEVVRLVRDWLGHDGLAHSVVRRDLPPFEHANPQVALDAWSAQKAREVQVRGLAQPRHFGPLSLQMLLHGDGLPPVRLSAPDLVDLPTGPDRTLACLRLGVLLVEDARGRCVLLVRGPDPREGEGLSLEVAGLPTADAQALLRELDELRSRLNVYRGQLLELEAGNGGVQVRFPRLPATSREDVVLPEDVLRRVERHSLDMAARREHLRAAGQHLKRGLLLYGPPGTGKTHTVRYLVQALEGTTVLLLSGQSLHLVGAVTSLARDLQPAALVLEDVDLVAEDRAYGPGPAPVLFELLDAMDGAAEDADLLFLLTTNRADLLEPALVARPGRVDVAVEIGLPDAAARDRLLGVYARHVPLELSDEERAAVVQQMEGVTASFVKELLRRSVLEALRDRPGCLQVVAGEHVQRALDDLLDSTQSVTRALLGVPGDQSGPPASPPFGAGRGAGGHGGWFAYAAEPGIMPEAYTSSMETHWEDQP
ncbi:MAG: AAA family ATPase [Actinomycetota bacterium]|nr:AAA family ATPase [Actinomycetota bacterium]